MSDSIVSLPSSEFAARLAALSALFTEDHVAFLGSPKVQEKCPGLTPADYLQDVVAKVDWTIALPIDMNDYPPGDAGFKEFLGDLKFAIQNYRHVNISNALTEIDGNTMEDIVPFLRIHAALAALCKDPLKECFVHLIGSKKNAFPNPLLMAQIGEEAGRKFRLKSGGFTVPGEAQSEIDFLVRPVDPSSGTPAVTICIMCGHLSNFHAMPSGLTARKMGCTPGVCPDKFLDAILFSAEQGLHLFKATAWLTHRSKFGLSRADVPVGKLKTLREDAGTSNAGEDDVDGLACVLVDKIAKLDGPTAADASKKAKALGRALPITQSYFDFASGVSMKTFMNLGAEELVKLGVQALIQAACLIARLSDPKNEDLRTRIHAGSKTFYLFAEIEGAIHGPKKSEAGVTLFSGDFIDWDWGMGGCTRNMSEVLALEHKTKLPLGHLGRGVSLVYGAMAADKDTMDYLGLSEPLTFENAEQTSGLVIDMIWRRINAAAASA